MAYPCFHLMFSLKFHIFSLSLSPSCSPAIGTGSLGNGLSTTKSIHWAPLSYIGCNVSSIIGGLPICVGEILFPGDYYVFTLVAIQFTLDRLSTPISVRHMFFLKSHVFSLYLYSLSLSLLPLAQEGWGILSPLQNAYIGRHFLILDAMFLVSYHIGHPLPGDNCRIHANV